jgi:hypothetical protein
VRPCPVWPHWQFHTDAFPAPRPEDKAILEAAYEQNPTPDKAARRELVRKCIDMSEARIQVGPPV